MTPVQHTFPTEKTAVRFAPHRQQAAEGGILRASADVGGDEDAAATMNTPPDRPLQTVHDAVCAGCGCLCDDVVLTIDGTRIQQIEHACTLGEQWFHRPAFEEHPACLLDGRESSIEEGIVRAAEILRSARNPLVAGLQHLVSESQAAAMSIADRIGANVDAAANWESHPVGSSLPGAATVSATLGEVRQRADLVIFWGTDPMTSHPRHLDRYSLNPTGLFVPEGRSGRKCIVVDVKKTETAQQADLFLKVRPGSDFEALWTLRALAKGIELDAECVQHQTGIRLARWRDVANQLQSARFGVFFHGSGLTTRGRHLVSRDALYALVRDLNRYTKFVAIANVGAGNPIGVNEIVASRTGYPAPVNFARGYPRHDSREYTAEKLLARREVDAALLLQCNPASELSAPARRHLSSIPSVRVGSGGAPPQPMCDVTFHVAPHGPGTIYRMDHVPIPLRTIFPSKLWSDLEILRKLDRQLTR